ncbi:HNH endonuclease [Rhodococcoides kyotonense]|uniref:HNH endonuclease n=1 Tax=Rhodococcoides kyotonense TaxID=398843 RepID=A0A239EFN5_9NOCA|nr:HNH endonuclease signature motif containing protein [Rhodococcus kyotonensis]SNS43466.1 HNH endonuclease [Rhodococcus kyotonensis]
MGTVDAVAVVDTRLTAAEVLAFASRIQQAIDLADAAAGIDLISALETVKSACAAVQATATDAVATAIATTRREAGLPKAQWHKGIASQIGLARRESPNKGGRFLGLAQSLVHEMPHTHQRLLAGELNEWRVTLLARETACLTVEDRREIDKRLCQDVGTLKGLGDKAIEAKARALAAELDPASVVKKRAKAFSQRRTSTRPQPDFMCQFTTLTSMDRAVAMWATLKRDADSMVGVGEETRTRDQIMADLAYQRITGAASAKAGAQVTVNLVISDDSLLSNGGNPAHLAGYGDIPAPIARHLVREASEADSTVELRRVYAAPGTGALTAMESKSRRFPTALARLIDIRDRTCRTPWCDAPIRHHDHIRAHARGGETSADNGAGLCAACNHAKEAEGWSSAPRPTKYGVVHVYDFETPTGHQYSSEAPPMPVVKHYVSFIEHDIHIDLRAA